MERRLAAIVLADVVGYSKLIRADEEGTRARFRTLQNDLFGPSVTSHGGRIIKTMGDAFLLEFPSAVKAVTCASEVQRALAERESEVDEDRRIRFRIGINLGDIIIEGDDIQGDGVNIAARLEAIAEPGGILISGSVYEQVRHHLEDVGIEFAGRQDVKNISEPVSTYRILLAADQADVRPDVEETSRKSRRPVLLASAIVLVIALFGGGAWWWIQPLGHEPADPKKTTYALPEKPSIAVLPFDNMSNDPKQEYFADGMAEDIITDLSNISGLFVIARNSSFAYKGKPIKVREVARELGVRYVLEGSVRKIGSVLRINAQLIDATTGNHLWARRYDGEMKDLFALQEQVTEQVVSALAISVSVAEQGRAFRKPTENLDAYDFALRGMNLHRRWSKENNRKALQMFERALELDPNYADAYAGLAWSHVHDFNFQWSDDPAASLALALKFATKAIALDRTLAKAYTVLGDALAWSRKQDEAVAAGWQAVKLSPNDADAHMMLAVYLGFQGSGEAAIDVARHALRLNPKGDWPYYAALGQGQYINGNYGEAAKSFEIATRVAPNVSIPFFYIMPAYGQLDRRDEALAAYRRFKEITGYDGPIDAAFLPFKESRDQKAYLDGFRKAGIPMK